MAVRTTYYDNGASQGERLLKALLPEYVKVDERDLSQLLTFVAQYSKLINFYNLKDEIHGDWYPFLIRDISIFIATISSIDLDEIRQKNYQYINDIIRSNSRKNDKIASLIAFFKSILSIAHRFNTWHVHLSKINTTLLREVEGIELEVQNAIRFKLKAELQKLRSYDLGAEKSDTIGRNMNLSYDDFDKDWEIFDDKIQPRNIYDSPHLSDFNARIDNALKKVQLVYRSFFNALTNIVNSSKKFLKESLSDDDSHQPHTSLLIAFLHIFRHNQNHLNTLTERHLDLYYSKILNQKRKSWKPDQTIAKFIMADHIDKFVLKAGTKLEVSRDALEYNPIYKTDTDLHISRAAIKSLRSLFVSKSLLVGTGSSYRLISNIYAAPFANSQDGLGTPFEDPKNRWWAPFGEEQLNKVAYERTMMHGDVGFVIASPILFLSEGERSVEVIFRFEEESMGTFRKLIVDMSRNEVISMEDAFFKMFANAFDLYMSTEEGWYDVQKYEVLPPSGNWTGNDLKLNFILTAQEPGIVANDPEVLGETFRTKWPLLKVVLNTDDFVYAYSFLRDLLLDSITINVDVKEMLELEVYNVDGKVSLASTFYPFGGIPEPMSYMMLGHEELVRKEITDMQLRIEWQKLPYNFDSHYSAYDLDITNESFKVQLSSLKNGKFIPEKQEDRENIRLFKEYETGNTDQLNPIRTIEDINLKKLKLEPKYAFRMPEEFNHTTRNGFLKFELVEPECAFGHEIYPEKLAEVINANIPEVDAGWFSSKSKPKKTKPLPKEPYNPIIRSLSLNYSATTEIVISPLIHAHDRFKTPENIFHIEPFGIVNTYSNGRTHNRSIVPQYNEDGYLFIGLENLAPPQLLTLLFPMSESAKGSRYYNLLDIEWSYLSSNEWKKFTPEEIVMDTTDSFTTIGIVTLEVPREINKHNTILPDDLHWLRVSIRGDVEILGKALEVETQAVTATWEPDSDVDTDFHLSNPLIPHEPIELKTILAEVSETLQPLGSFHGEPSETNTEYYARISERLRHKNRAVSHWDYEHLILNKFSDIYQVKCLSHLTNPNFVKHGNLLFVAVPKIQPNSINKLPVVNTSLLQDIKEYLQKNTSPFVNIEVRNPEYEKIKISCSVAFTEGNNNGQTLKRLNKDIKSFTCPWLFGEEAELELGGSITKDNLLDFIEKRPYVAFVTKFSVVQVTKLTELYNTEDTAVSKDIAPVIYASKPWAVIVPIDKHQISVIENYNYQAPEMSAMDTMMLDVDFVIRSEGESEEEEEDQESEIFYPEELNIRGIIADDLDDHYILDIEIDFD